MKVRGSKQYRLTADVATVAFVVVIFAVLANIPLLVGMSQDQWLAVARVTLSIVRLAAFAATLIGGLVALFSVIRDQGKFLLWPIAVCVVARVVLLLADAGLDALPA